MNALKSKLYFIATIMMVITVFAGCPHKPINPPELPDNNDSTETIQHQLNFKIIWRNATGVELSLNTESYSVDGATINNIELWLNNEEITDYASVSKLVDIDSAHTIEMYKQEMLASVLNAINTVNLRYFENGMMYSFSDNGELLNNVNDYMEINDSTIQLNITKDLLARKEFTTKEGEEQTVAIKWQNKFTRPISLHINSSKKQELNINRQINPDEVVKIVDLSYFTYPNEDEINKKMLSDAMTSYKALLDEVTFMLPNINDSSELVTGVWTGDSIATNGFESSLIDIFNLDNYEINNNDYLLILYNRLLYYEFVPTFTSFIKTTYSVYWNNNQSAPMTVNIRYRKDKIYTYFEGDQQTFTIQPGESFQMPDLVIYEEEGSYYYISPADVCWDMYLQEMEQVNVSCGDEVRNISGKDIKDYLTTRLVN